MYFESTCPSVSHSLQGNKQGNEPWGPGMKNIGLNQLASGLLLCLTCGRESVICHTFVWPWNICLQAKTMDTQWLYKTVVLFWHNCFKWTIFADWTDWFKNHHRITGIPQDLKTFAILKIKTKLFTVHAKHRACVQ